MINHLWRYIAMPFYDNTKFFKEITNFCPTDDYRMTIWICF